MSALDPVGEIGKARVRHVRRGSTYIVEGSGHLQTDTSLSDMAELIAYRSEEDGRLWFRPPSEFGDGRFERLEPTPIAAANNAPALRARIDHAPIAGLTPEKPSREDDTLSWSIQELLSETPKNLATIIMAQRDALRAAEARAEKVEARLTALHAALTPCVETKAAYSGEFSFNIYYTNEEGAEEPQRHSVPWTTVKEIMAAILGHAALHDGGGAR